MEEEIVWEQANWEEDDDGGGALARTGNDSTCDDPPFHTAPSRTEVQGGSHNGRWTSHPSCPCPFPSPWGNIHHFPL